MENKLRMCVPCHFGLESVLAYEIKKIGGENLTTTDGKISFEGGFDVLAKANLWIATGERVLIELGSFRAESFEQLFDGVMNLPLENFIGREDAFPVKGGDFLVKHTKSGGLRSQGIVTMLSPPYHSPMLSNKCRCEMFSATLIITLS